MINDIQEKLDDRERNMKINIKNNEIIIIINNKKIWKTKKLRTKTRTGKQQ